MKAIACELPAAHGLPLSRFSRAELHRLVVERGLCAASASTIARWLAEDALKPWQYRSWVFPSDPDFLEKAGRVLDLYAGRWQGRLLHPGDLVLCADEKPSIQARRRIHDSLPPCPGVGQRVEHSYKRRGALTYLAAWDVRRGRVCGRSEPKGGIDPFDRLVRQVMTKEPSALRPARFLGRRQRLLASRSEGRRATRAPLAEPRPRPPAAARELAQPDRDLLLDRAAQAAHAERVRRSRRPRPRPQRVEHHYNQIAKPFDWQFTRDDLAQLVARLALHEPALKLAA